MFLLVSGWCDGEEEEEDDNDDNNYDNGYDNVGISFSICSISAKLTLIKSKKENDILCRLGKCHTIVTFQEMLHSCLVCSSASVSGTLLDTYVPDPKERAQAQSP